MIHFQDTVETFEPKQSQRRAEYLSKYKIKPKTGKSSPLPPLPSAAAPPDRQPTPPSSLPPFKPPSSLPPFVPPPSTTGGGWQCRICGNQEGWPIIFFLNSYN